MNGEYSLGRGDGAVALAIIDELTKLYAEVYAEPPYSSSPLYEEQAFISRTTRQADREEFAIVLARDSGGQLIGFSFGLPFQPGKWWAGDATPPPEELLSAAKFAVIELVVKVEWRGHGLGGRLLSDLLRERPEKYAILTADPDAPARQIYTHWGWEQIGTARHTDDASVMDQLVLRR